MDLLDKKTYETVLDKIAATVTITDEGTLVFNRTVKVEIVNWDEEAQTQILERKGFRITEKGKTDVDVEPGLYSIHSPLYGTDYSDEHGFEDRYSCKCGHLQGKHYMDSHTVCPICKTKVEFIDIDMTKTGWIILDRDYIIQSIMAKKIWNFIGKNRFLPMIEYKEPDKREITPDNPFVGIGIIEFRHRFGEIMDYYFKRFPQKLDQYLHIMSNRDKVFTRSIPVYNMHLRQFVVRDNDIKYSDEDTLFRRIFSNSELLNDSFELQRRRRVRADRERRRIAKGEEPRPGAMEYLRRENILFSIQLDLDKLWDLSFESIDKKTGIIRMQISGGRQNYTARNVIISGVGLRQDQIRIGYITFLEVFKLEVLKALIDEYNITYNEASDMWSAASTVFDQNVYDVMCHIIQRSPIYITICRNPSINDGSMMGMQIVGITSDITDHCMELPPLILKKPNADFDGDIMNEVMHPIQSVAKETYKLTNPADNMIISHNDGLLDSDALPFKDMEVTMAMFSIM